jgi:oligoendopeptidase F
MKRGLRQDYEGKVATLTAGAGVPIARFETGLMGRIGSYASLYYAQDMADPERGRFSQNVARSDRRGPAGARSTS